MKKQIHMTAMLANRLYEVLGITTLYKEMEAKKDFGSTRDSPITLGKEGGIFLRDNSNTKIKLSKLLKALGVTDCSTELERYNTLWKEFYDIDTSTVKITEAVSMVYDLPHEPSGDLGSSCMRYKPDYMEVYEYLDTKVAYIEEEGVLKARSLLWDRNIVDDKGDVLIAHDRIFSSNERYKITLNKYFKDRDIKHVDNYEVCTTESLEGAYFEYLPYIDNMCYLGSDYRLNNEGDDFYGLLQSTEGIYTYNGGRDIGNTESNSYCNHCEESVDYDEEDMEYVEGVGEVCPYCIDDYYAHTHDTDEWVLRDDLYYVEDIGRYYKYNDDLYYVEDGECYYKYNDDLYYVEEENEYYEEECHYLDRLEELRGEEDED